MGEPRRASTPEQADQLDVVRRRGEVVAEVDDRPGHAPATEGVEDEDVDPQAAQSLISQSTAPLDTLAPTSASSPVTVPAL